MTNRERFYDYEYEGMGLNEDNVGHVLRQNGYTRDADVRGMVLWRDLFLTISLIINVVLVIHALAQHL